MTGMGILALMVFGAIGYGSYMYYLFNLRTHPMSHVAPSIELQDLSPPLYHQQQ
jgi:hypothetical protein